MREKSHNLSLPISCEKDLVKNEDLVKIHKQLHYLLNIKISRKFSTNSRWSLSYPLAVNDLTNYNSNFNIFLQYKS